MLIVYRLLHRSFLRLTFEQILKGRSDIYISFLHTIRWRMVSYQSSIALNFLTVLKLTSSIKKFFLLSPILLFSITPQVLSKNLF